MYNVQLLTDVK